MVARKKSPKKKTAGKKGARKKSVSSRKLARKSKARNNARRTAAGIVLLLAVAAAVIFGAKLIWEPSQVARKSPPAKPSVTPPKYDSVDERAGIDRAPDYEVYPSRDLPAERTPPPDAIPEHRRPRVAIIIDDLGYGWRLAEKFAKTDVVRTFSIFPHSPHRRQVVEIASKYGIEQMIHLPMEPEEYPTVKPGPGALLMSMGPDELIEQLNGNLEQIPGAAGVNNHMGSRMTADADRMNQVFSVLKRHRLFFIDSRTTIHTMSRHSARLLQVPFAQRDVFLDNNQAPEAIRKQIQRLLKIARIHGEALGIGHPYSITQEVLLEMSPTIKAAADLVPASSLVRVIPYSPSG